MASRTLFFLAALAAVLPVTGCSSSHSQNSAAETSESKTTTERAAQDAPVNQSATSSEQPKGPDVSSPVKATTDRAAQDAPVNQNTTGSEKPKAANPNASEFHVQLFTGEGQPPSLFIVINDEDQPIEDFKITTYPPPLTGNLLLPQYSFFKQVPTIEKGGMVNISPDGLKNEKGERLSDSKMKVGVVHLMGKVSGKPKGVMLPLSK